jgi:hypothetical protein
MAIAKPRCLAIAMIAHWGHEAALPDGALLPQGASFQRYST